ncbi:hypothetical protein M1446_04595 [Candidatus Dependentiae bacterium]|nr:hypothetical protein [Candidatus Dependentiae bacterium]
MGVKNLLPVILIFISGCLHQAPKRLKKIDINSISSNFKETKDNVTLEVTNIDEKCKDFFGKDLRPAKINTLLFTIKNTSDNVVSLKSDNLGIKTRDPQKVLSKLSMSTKSKLLAESVLYVGIASFIVIPIIITSMMVSITAFIYMLAGSTTTGTFMGLGSGLIGLGCSCLILAGPFLIVDSGLHSAQNNQELRTTFEKNTLISNNKLSIQPSNDLSFVVFVDRKNYKKNFNVILENSLNQKIDFEIKL